MRSVTVSSHLLVRPSAHYQNQFVSDGCHHAPHAYLKHFKMCHNLTKSLKYRFKRIFTQVILFRSFLYHLNMTFVYFQLISSVFSYVTYLYIWHIYSTSVNDLIWTHDTTLMQYTYALGTVMYNDCVFLCRCKFQNAINRSFFFLWFCKLTTIEF